MSRDIVRRPSTGPLAALGVGALAEEIYRLCLRHSGTTVDTLCDSVGRPLAAVEQDLQELVEHQLVTVSQSVVRAEPPEFALGRLVNHEARRLAESADALNRARDEVNTYVAEHIVGQRAEWQPVGVDVIPGSELSDVMLTLVATTVGEMVFLRPDQWFLPTGELMDAVVTEAIDAGRASRVIYPARVIESSPENVIARARAGEQIRVLPDLPTRMAVFGNDAAILPELWGSPGGARLLIRQPAIVGACIAYFNELWSHAVTTPGYGAELEVGERKQLLELLAGGAKDEQIARTVGMSLRTVRRRIASLMTELGVDSRFQAGMEAVRRGWL